MALVNIRDLIATATDTNKLAIGIFLDFTKAFVTVVSKVEHIRNKMSTHVMVLIIIFWIINTIGPI